MPYNPHVEMNILKKALAIGAEHAIDEIGIASEANVKLLVALWIKQAREFYKAKSAAKKKVLK